MNPLLYELSEFRDLQCTSTPSPGTEFRENIQYCSTSVTALSRATTQVPHLKRVVTIPMTVSPAQAHQCSSSRKASPCTASAPVKAHGHIANVFPAIVTALCSLVRSKTAAAQGHADSTSWTNCCPFFSYRYAAVPHQRALLHISVLLSLLRQHCAQT